MFSLNRRLGIPSTIALLSLAGLIGFMSPASASTVGSARSGIAGVATTTTLPNVNIQHSPATWNPTKVTVQPKNYSTCTTAEVVWTITNKTTKAQTISYSVGSSKRKLLGTFRAGTRAGICSKGPAGTKETFFMKGSTEARADFALVARRCSCNPFLSHASNLSACDAVWVRLIEVGEAVEALPADFARQEGRDCRRTASIVGLY
jgi:hypothetical protein